MTSRFVFSLAVLLCTAIHSPPAAAQPKAPAPIQPVPTFKLVKSIGTTAEATTIETIVSRVRKRVETDAVFNKQVEDAFGKNDLAGVKALFGSTAQLPVDQVWIANVGSRTSEFARPSLFHYVSAERFNPFAVVVIVGNHGLCFGLKAACREAFAAIGWQLDADR